MGGNASSAHPSRGTTQRHQPSRGERGNVWGMAVPHWIRRQSLFWSLWLSKTWDIPCLCYDCVTIVLRLCCFRVVSWPLVAVFGVFRVISCRFVLFRCRPCPGRGLRLVAFGPPWRAILHFVSSRPVAGASCISCHFIWASSLGSARWALLAGLCSLGSARWASSASPYELDHQYVVDPCQQGLAQLRPWDTASARGTLSSARGNTASARGNLLCNLGRAQLSVPTSPGAQTPTSEAPPRACTERPPTGSHTHSPLNGLIVHALDTVARGRRVESSEDSLRGSLSQKHSTAQTATHRDQHADAASPPPRPPPPRPNPPPQT